MNYDKLYYVISLKVIKLWRQASNNN